ncbi:MAG: thymidine phosphorylase [Acidobacteria bacterium]|nr:thymidine phosphorylase [Acidobacteriota bacterium]
MRIVDLIQIKRDGGEFSREEVDFFLQGFLKGEIADFQASALLMAIYFHGLTDQELADWAESAASLATPLDLGDITGPKISKHSTGGVGDKTSLIVAPLVAAAGITVPVIVNRGLAHSGGSLDKVESIPGFNAGLNGTQLKSALKNAGSAFLGQTAEHAPVDRKLDSLRNATGSVESVSLIAASILSRKLAEKTDGLVVDVKTGSGALMKKMTDSRRLAQALVTVGKRLDQKVMAIITDMDQPLGNAVGNALEVMEAVEAMRGGGPEDLVELSLELASRIVCMAHPDRTLEGAKDQMFKLLNEGAALQKFRQILEAQGGNAQVIDSFELLPNASADFVVSSPRAGYVSRISADDIGHAVALLGGARETMDSRIDAAVGIVLEHKVGDRIQAGERLCTIYYNTDTHLEEASAMVEDAFHIAAAAPEKRPLVYEVIQ